MDEQQCADWVMYCGDGPVTTFVILSRLMTLVWQRKVTDAVATEVAYRLLDIEDVEIAPSNEY